MAPGTKPGMDLPDFEHASAAAALDRPTAEPAHDEAGLDLAAGLPFQVGGVAVDFLAPEAHEPFLEAAPAAVSGSIIDAAPFIYTKLKASRMQDRADVVALIKAGLDVEACRSYLRANSSAFVARFEDLVSVAIAEED
jgi:hypothetical protein